MKFRVICQKTSSGAHSPIQVVEQSTGKGVAWINRYLDREYVRRLANKSLLTYAHSLLHFVRWWESVHHTGEISAADLTESTLFDYLRFQSSRQPPPSATTINDRVACADRAIRNLFPDAPCQVAHGFHKIYLHRRPMGLGRPRFELSRLRIKEPRLNIVPLSVDEVARFWSSFRNARDLAIVGLMLLHGLRSVEVIALNRDDVLLSEGQLRVRGKGNKLVKSASAIGQGYYFDSIYGGGGEEMFQRARNREARQHRGGRSHTFRTYFDTQSRPPFCRTSESENV
jgi:integrase